MNKYGICCFQHPIVHIAYSQKFNTRIVLTSLGTRIILEVPRDNKTMPRSRNIRRFKGNKTDCFPREQSLIALLYSIKKINHSIFLKKSKILLPEWQWRYRRARNLNQTKFLKVCIIKVIKKPSMFTYSIHIYLWLKFIITFAPDNNVPCAGNKIV